MAITNYAELKVAIQDYLKRSDCLSMLDTFIDLAEVDIWSLLRVREMEARATASTSTSDRFVALPAGFIKMRQLQITVDSSLYDLEFVPLKNMNVNSDAGIPYLFTVTSQIELNRVSDQAYTLEIDYFRELTALSGSNTTNDILTYYPMVYLSGCLNHAFRWALQTDMADYWESQFNKNVASANRKSRNGRFGPAPAMRINKGMVI